MPDLKGSPDEPAVSDRLARAVDEFVLLWGEMATSWGINRTMAQIHALLYVTARQLDTDEIMETLQISRGNANMNLRALLDWRLVRKTHQLGSRKDYFVAETDVWTITTTIIEERQRRELQPVRRALVEVSASLREGDALTGPEREVAERVEGYTEIMEVFDSVTNALLPFLRGHNADKVKKVVQFASRLRQKSGDSAARSNA